MSEKETLVSGLWVWGCLLPGIITGAADWHRGVSGWMVSKYELSLKKDTDGHSLIQEASAA